MPGTVPGIYYNLLLQGGGFTRYARRGRACRRWPLLSTFVMAMFFMSMFVLAKGLQDPFNGKDQDDFNVDVRAPKNRPNPPFQHRAHA